MCAVDGMASVCGLAGAGGFFAGVYADENFPCGMSFGGAGGRRLWQRPRRGHILSPKYLFAFIAQRVALRNALEGGVLCAVESLAAARDRREAVLIGAGAAAERWQPLSRRPAGARLRAASRQG